MLFNPPHFGARAKHVLSYTVTRLALTEGTNSCLIFVDFGPFQTKIGKADILKLTVQYIRRLKGGNCPTLFISSKLNYSLAVHFAPFRMLSKFRGRRLHLLSLLIIYWFIKSALSHTNYCIYFLVERMENVGEDQETVEICNRESSARISLSENNFGKPSVCSTKEQTKQTEERNILEKDVSSDNSKFYDSGYVSNQIFSSKSQSCSTRSTLFGNTTNDCGKDAVKRKPFRQLNYNNNRGTDRQTIWRPW